jgi:hypothetical protein
MWRYLSIGIGRYTKVMLIIWRKRVNDWLLEQLPWDLDMDSAIVTFACYEREGKPIILKNGAKLYPEGWMRFLRMSDG